MENVIQTKFQTEFQTGMTSYSGETGETEVFSENESRDCTPVSGDPYL